MKYDVFICLMQEGKITKQIKQIQGPTFFLV